MNTNIEYVQQSKKTIGVFTHITEDYEKRQNCQIMIFIYKQRLLKRGFNFILYIKLSLPVESKADVPLVKRDINALRIVVQ